MQPQLHSTCPVCKGKKFLGGRIVRGGPSTTAMRCPQCHGEGTAPAGDLAQWQEEMEALLRYPNAYSSLSVLGDVLRRHLAAMPTRDVHAELVVAMRDCEEPGCLLQSIGHSHVEDEPMCAECQQPLWCF